MECSRVGLISLGCGKNLVNSEQMLRKIADAGCEITDDYENADVVVINTCGFIDSAKSEAIDTILEIAALKDAAGYPRIVVAGCLAERYREQIVQEMPEVDAVLGCGSFERIMDAIEEIDGKTPPMLFGDIDAPLDETERIITGAGGWTYLKIADGCDNRCAYCVIPALRGRFRSRKMENILAEAKLLSGEGIKELLVIAQDITRYGTDMYGKRMLAELLRQLCRIDGIRWLRLHYLYPDEIDDELIDVIAGEEKILKYLDIPIQHINSAILRRMNRRGTGEEIRELFKKLRSRIPGLVLRTSLITGLPGEGEKEFEELCDFLREAKIERAGVFPYSPEEGTPAAEMTDRADEETAERRAQIIMSIQDDIMERFNAGRLGSECLLLCDGYDEQLGCFYGRSWAESPDIDGRILLDSEAEPGKLYSVRITGESGGELTAEIKGESV